MSKNSKLSTFSLSISKELDVHSSSRLKRKATIDETQPPIREKRRTRKVKSPASVSFAPTSSFGTGSPHPAAPSQDPPSYKDLSHFTDYPRPEMKLMRVEGLRTGSLPPVYGLPYPEGFVDRLGARTIVGFQVQAQMVFYLLKLVLRDGETAK